MPTDYFFLLYWKLIIKSHYFNKYNQSVYGIIIKKFEKRFIFNSIS